MNMTIDIGRPSVLAGQGGQQPPKRLSPQGFSPVSRVPATALGDILHGQAVAPACGNA